MTIGIDGKPLTLTFPCGLREYAWQLIAHLAEIDHQNTYLIFSPIHIKLPRQSNFILRVGIPAIPWQIQLPFLARREKIDVFHFLQQHGSIFLHHPKIIATIHDLATQAVYPRWWENLYYGIMPYYTNMVRQFLLKRATTLITESQATRQELIGLGIKTPIVVVPNGVGGISPPPLTMKKEHILAMTDFSPRKNIGRTIAAYAELPLKLRRLYPLVIVISMEAPRQLIERTARKLGVSKFVRIEKQVSRQRLIQLYQKALVFIYPSLYEGFGLPILEAMACGCPVITSNCGAPQEVAGPAAYLVNPTSTMEIARALEKMLRERRLRQKFSKLGYARVKQFSWETSARATLKIYEKLAAA